MPNEWHLTSERPPTMLDFASAEDIAHESKFEHVKGLSGEIHVSYADDPEELYIEAEIYFPLRSGRIRWETHLSGIGYRDINVPKWWRKR